MARKLSYADAMRILGTVDSPVLRAINQILGGAIVVVTAATGRLEILSLLDARKEILARTQELLSKIGKRVRGSRGKTRTDLLIAAHAIIVVNSYFEALGHDRLPVDLTRLELTNPEKFRLAGASPRASATSLIEFALNTPMPVPAAHRPYERTVLELRQSYRDISERLINFISGLAIWEEISASDKSKFRRILLDHTPSRAVTIYEESFHKLSNECPEFRHWIRLVDSIATRATIDMGFVQLQKDLQSLVGRHAASKWPERLTRSYRRALDEPLVDTSPDEYNLGLRIPLLNKGYVPPSFRIAEYAVDARPGHKSWWDNLPLYSDLANFIVGHLTSPAADETPLVVLGDPGSGKSLFTKMLAASLPPADYLPIRVELRRVAANIRIRDQIEQAMTDTTNERMEWSKLAEEAGDALPVVLLDGYDELLQATEISQSDYLQEIQEFQRTETSQGRRVAFVVTSRMIAADRVRFPEETVIVKLEPFSDEGIAQWLRAWNTSNAGYFDQYGLQSLTLDTVLRHEDLARQPLLLLMLALYDTDANSLQRSMSDISRADLYEELLRKFVAREVDKRWRGMDGSARLKQVTRELHELSVLALGMFNRGLKGLSEAQLESDLREFGLARDDLNAAFSQPDHPLSEGELAVGRFFLVVHDSQIMVSDRYLREYEFLHATFGEYLVARMITLALEQFVGEDALPDSGGNATTATEPIADYLWTLLSFASLADGSQTTVFINERIGRIDGRRKARLEERILSLFLDACLPHSTGYEGYEPTKHDVVARHAIYSANLLILLLFAADRPIFAADTLRGYRDVIGRWRSLALLWRSQLGIGGWENLVRMLSVIRVQREHGLDIEICLAPQDPGDLDKRFGMLDWQLMHTLDESSRDAVFLARQASFMCLAEEDLLIHGVLPLIRKDPHILSDLVTYPNNTCRSVMHETLREAYSYVREKADGVKAKEGLMHKQSASGAGPTSGDVSA